jgi:hypothetical protein
MSAFGGKADIENRRQTCLFAFRLKVKLPWDRHGTRTRLPSQVRERSWAAGVGDNYVVVFKPPAVFNRETPFQRIVLNVRIVHIDLPKACDLVIHTGCFEIALSESDQNTDPPHHGRRSLHSWRICGYDPPLAPVQKERDRPMAGPPEARSL